jgi:hypothetical protein
MIAWREKFLATSVHFAVTLLLTGIAAAIIFLVWFPDPMQTMIGGTELFLIVVGVDLALGPLMSLVIFNSRKSRRELVIDYSIVGVIQIVALVYGVMVVAGARPAYYAFDKDRYEIVSAVDITDKELAAAKESQYRKLPWTGPRIVAISIPPEDQQDALFQAMEGNEAQLRPKFYVPLSAKLDAIRRNAKTIAELEAKKPAYKALLEEAVASVDIPAERIAWLPVRHRKGFAAVIIDTSDGKPLAWADFDPY